MTFTPPTGRMGNGEVERALTLASRDLRTAGISNPTPEQLQVALMGGTVTNGQGQSTSMDGVLTLRSQGMGWGQIAHTIGVHPSQSEQGAANSRRAGSSNGASSFASIGGGGRTDRSAHTLSSSSDRNQVSQSATAISSSSAAAIASAGNRDSAPQAQDSQRSRVTARSGDSARIDTRINSRVGDNGSERGPSAQGRNRSDARNTASISRGGDFNAGRSKGSDAAAAGPVSTESVFGGPAHAGPGAASRSQVAGKANSRADANGSGSASALSGPGAGGSFSATAGGTSAGSELSGGVGGGHGKGNGGGKGK